MAMTQLLEKEELQEVDVPIRVAHAYSILEQKIAQLKGSIPIALCGFSPNKIPNFPASNSSPKCPVCLEVVKFKKELSSL